MNEIEIIGAIPGAEHYYGSTYIGFSKENNKYYINSESYRGINPYSWEIIPNYVGECLKKWIIEELKEK